LLAIIKNRNELLEVLFEALELHVVEEGNRNNVKQVDPLFLDKINTF